MMTPIWDFGSIRLYYESEFKESKVGRLKLKSKLWKVFDHTKFMKQDDSGQPNAFSKINMDNQSWKPLGVINDKFPVAVPVGKGV